MRTVLTVIAVAAGVAFTSWTLHAQDPDTASLDMLNMKVVALTQQVTALQQQIATLQKQGSRVHAPFEVVDAAGKVAVRLAASTGGEGQIVVMSKAGQTGVGISGDGNVGVFSGGSNVAVLKAEARR